MIRSTLGALAVMSAMVGTTTAADLVVMAPAMVEPDMSYDWSGLYVGGFGGYAVGSTNLNFVDVPSDVDVDTEGWLAGVALGANAQDGSLVYGIEADLAWADITGVAPCPNPAFDCSSSIDWLGTVRGRVGFAADSFLVYATAGLAAGGVTSNSEFNGDFESTHIGWAAGAGVEVGVAENVSLKAEYLYVDLGTQTDDGGILSGVSDTEVSATASLAKVGLNFHF